MIKNDSSQCLLAEVINKKLRKKAGGLINTTEHNTLLCELRKN